MIAPYVLTTERERTAEGRLGSRQLRRRARLGAETGAGPRQIRRLVAPDHKRGWAVGRRDRHLLRRIDGGSGLSDAADRAGAVMAAVVAALINSSVARLKEGVST